MKRLTTTEKEKFNKMSFKEQMFVGFGRQMTADHGKFYVGKELE